MIALAAAAMTTRRIRLGTMVVPAPIRRPWKVASESVAVDRLSNGRLTLGLGTGAVWEDAGVTWWIEFFWGDPEERVPEVIKQGPPSIS